MEREGKDGEKVNKIRIIFSDSENLIQCGTLRSRCVIGYFWSKSRLWMHEEQFILNSVAL